MGPILLSTSSERPNTPSNMTKPNTGLAEKNLPKMRKMSTETKEEREPERMRK